MTDVILAIDLGTSATKMLAIDRAGTIHARERLPHATFAPVPGTAEQNPMEWWQNICHGVRNLMDTLPGGDIAAISVTGQMHGLVVHDADGCSPRPAITWQDRRSVKTLPSLTERLASTRYAPIETGYQAASWHWLAGAEPEVAARVRRILLPKDDIVYRLTGEHVTDPSDAIGTGWYDPIIDGWDTSVVNAAMANLDLLPGVVPSGSIAGFLLPDASRELGLDAGIPVVIAGGDAAVGTFGAGAVEPGSPLLMLSTGCQVMETSSTMPNRGGWPSANPPGLPPWLRVATTRNGGNVVTWARDTFGDPATTGDDDLVFLPYLAGERTTNLSSVASGAFIGLRERHTRADMARAAIDGVTLAVADAFERIGGQIGVESPLIVGGGGVRDTEWLASVARVFARPVVAISEPDLSAWGAARSAATALGWIAPAHEPDVWLPESRPVASGAEPADAVARLRRFQELAGRLWGVQMSETI